MGVPSTYHPCIGFTHLSTKFHIWNDVSSGGTSIRCLGLQPNGAIFYSAKLFSSSRVRTNPLLTNPAHRPYAQLRAGKHSAAKAQSPLPIIGSFIKETRELQEGATWPFKVNVGGIMQEWAWRKRRSHGAIIQLVGALTQSKLGRWELAPELNGGKFGAPMATFEPVGGNTLEKNSHLGVLEFHSYALTEDMGNFWTNVVVIVFVRIISQHCINILAGLAG